MSSPALRSSAIDLLRLILSICVVAIHTIHVGPVPSMLRQMTVNGLFRFAVPIFALISGYFFLKAVREGHVRAYIARLCTLYAVWMILYLPNYSGQLKTLNDAAWMAMVGFFHLWYMPALIISTVAVWGLVRLRASLRVIGALAVAAALTGVAMQFLVLTGRSGISIDYYRSGPFFIFPYFALGYLLSTNSHRLAEWKPSWALVVMALTAVAIESLLWFRISGSEGGIDHLVSLWVAAPILFLAALRRDGFGHGKNIASVAAFIYFIHIHAMVLPYNLGLSGIEALVAVVVASAIAGLMLALLGQGRVIRAVT